MLSCMSKVIGKVFCLIFVFALSANSMAQLKSDLHKSNIPDLSVKTNTKWYKTEVFRKGAVPAALIGVGLYTFKDKGFLSRTSIHDMRNRYVPQFSNKLDDYLQYAPIAAVYGLNLVGVKGQHSYQRATVSLGMSFLMSAAIVHAGKTFLDVERPDGSSNNSFPSGHTTTAFVAATFLHKEFGQYRSPIYSILGYTSATTIGIYRQLNNRHWISDVLVGAGIGIVSTEICYAFAEAIYKDKGKNKPLYLSQDDPHDYPSFLSYSAGPAFFVNSHMSDMLGFSVGVQGNYYYSKYFGVVGEASFSSFPFNSKSRNLGVIKDEILNNPIVKERVDSYVVQPVGFRNIMVGQAFNYPLPSDFSLDAKICVGYSVAGDGNFVVNVKPEYQEEMGKKEVVVAKYDAKDSWIFSSGVGIRKRLARNLSLRFYYDIYLNRTKVTVTKVSDIISPQEYQIAVVHKSNNEQLGYSTFGLSLVALLW